MLVWLGKAARLEMLVFRVRTIVFLRLSPLPLREVVVHDLKTIHLSLKVLFPILGFLCHPLLLLHPLGLLEEVYWLVNVLDLQPPPFVLADDCTWKKPNIHW